MRRFLLLGGQISPIHLSWAVVDIRDSPAAEFYQERAWGNLGRNIRSVLLEHANLGVGEVVLVEVSDLRTRQNPEAYR